MLAEIGKLAHAELSGHMGSVRFLASHNDVPAGQSTPALRIAKALCMAANKGQAARYHRINWHISPRLLFR